MDLGDILLNFQCPLCTCYLLTFCLTFYHLNLLICWVFLVAQMKNLPAMQEMQVQSLGQEDPLEEEMANSSSILAWRIPWMEEPGRLQSMRLQRVGHDWETSLSLSICCHLKFRILFIWQLNKWMFQLPYSCALFKYQQGNAHNTPS